MGQDDAGKLDLWVSIQDVISLSIPMFSMLHILAARVSQSVTVTVVSAGPSRLGD